jgi:hypothetical protein
MVLRMTDREGRTVALAIGSVAERLVKSVGRVRDLGEVFTPNATVQEMLDLLPPAAWTPHPAHTFLEPACGDGNFLVAILDRKLEEIARHHSAGMLAAGATATAARFHALEALASIYAVDISAENVIGGTPGHEIGARDRLLARLNDWNARFVLPDRAERAQLLQAARWVVDHNVLIGNMLPVTAEGRSTGRDALPLIEYDWEPVALTVRLRQTTMGAVMAAAQTDSAGTAGLFASGPLPELWSGEARRLSEASKVEAPALVGPARNGVTARER